MGFEEGSIVLENNTGTYRPGDAVNGRVVFELVKVKEIRGIQLKLKGFCKVHWTSRESRRVNDRTEHYTVNHDGYEEYIRMNMYLVGSSSGSITLHPGTHDYPFSVRLPPSCPSSYESEHAHIRYQVKAVADRAFKTDQTIHRAITVFSPVDLNTINCSEPTQFEFEQTYCCWCSNAGSSQTLVKLPATGFCPGQEVPLEVSCHNTSSVELERIRFEITRTKMYTATDVADTKHVESQVLSLSKGPVPAGAERSWRVDLLLPQLDVYNLAGCSLINVWHTFKVTVEPDGCHSNADKSCRIIFGNIPLRMFQGNLPEPPPGQLPQTTLNYPYPPPVVNQPAINQNAYPGVTSPYPAQNPTVSPYPPTTSPYPDANPPYPGANPQYPNTSPYPARSNPPYPNTNSPYPNTNSPYPPTNPPYPVSPGQINSPYPSGPPNASPYPAPNPYPAPSPYPVSNDVLVRSANPGMGGQNPMPMPIPSLPPGAAVPYPPNSSPYASASAPVPATPDSEQKPEYGANSSPFNPEFMGGQK